MDGLPAFPDEDGNVRGRRGGLSGHSLPEKFRPGETRIYVGQPNGDGPSCASRL